jgi:hypothetical protein
MFMSWTNLMHALLMEGVENLILVMGWFADGFVRERMRARGKVVLFWFTDSQQSYPFPLFISFLSHKRGTHMVVSKPTSSFLFLLM